MRTFIAVQVPETIRQHIGDFQDQLKHFRSDVKWVRPESIHMTLKFIGNVAPETIDDIGKAVQEAVTGIAPFSVSIGGVGTFPNDRRPRVLWIGITNGCEILSRLAIQIEDVLSGLGFEKEKRAYSPHLTLGRVRSLNHIQSTVERMYALDFRGGDFEVNTVAVMKSDLYQTGAVYTALKTVKLRG